MQSQQQKQLTNKTNNMKSLMRNNLLGILALASMSGLDINEPIPYGRVNKDMPVRPTRTTFAWISNGTPNQRQRRKLHRQQPHGR